MIHKHVYKCEFQNESQTSTWIYVIATDVATAVDEAKYWIRERKEGNWTCISCERAIAELNVPRP